MADIGDPCSQLIAEDVSIERSCARGEREPLYSLQYLCIRRRDVIGHGVSFKEGFVTRTSMMMFIV